MSKSRVLYHLMFYDEQQAPVRDVYCSMYIPKRATYAVFLYYAVQKLSKEQGYGDILDRVLKRENKFIVKRGGKAMEQKDCNKNTVMNYIDVEPTALVQDYGNGQCIYYIFDSTFNNDYEPENDEEKDLAYDDKLYDASTEKDWKKYDNKKVKEQFWNWSKHRYTSWK
eukprot:510045_1